MAGASPNSTLLGSSIVRIGKDVAPASAARWWGDLGSILGNVKRLGRKANTVCWSSQSRTNALEAGANLIRYGG
jgi:hypothetical protein